MMAMTFIVDEFNVRYAAEREKHNTTPSKILDTEGTTIFILSRTTGYYQRSNHPTSLCFLMTPTNPPHPRLYAPNLALFRLVYILGDTCLVRPCSPEWGCCKSTSQISFIAEHQANKH
jgi:hypothetical protein